MEILFQIACTNKQYNNKAAMQEKLKKTVANLETCQKELRKPVTSDKKKLF